MPRNPQGLYTLPLPPVQPNTLIETQWANPTMDDIASALTGSLPRDGSAPMTGPLTLAAGDPTLPRHATSKAYVDQFMAYATGMPLGSIVPVAGATVPLGFLECNGQTVSRTTYADLFGAIGTIYGSGDGSTTFTLPDLRDWFIRGKADARPVGSTEAAAFASHTHVVSDPTHTHGASQAAHDHSITTGGHSHGVNDPGHSHTATFYTHNDNGPLLGNANGGAAGTMTTTTVGTGISIGAVGNLGGSADARQPAVTVNGAATGISIGVNGGTETRPQNVAMIYVIKAVNDSAGPGVITGISSSDVNMIAIDNTNPLVPELDIKSNVPFGIPKLDTNAKVALSQLPAGVQSFLGTYDASTNLNPTEAFPSNVYVDGNTYLISTQGTINVFNPNTNVSASTLVELGWNLVYISNLSQPVGWYFIEAAVVTAAIASQVAFTPSGTIDAIEVQAAIEELDNETQVALATKAELGSALPGMDGTANAGLATDASRTDHIHPTDTTRAPASAATAAGTSYVPQGGIGATDVQGALTELDTEKATVAYVNSVGKGPACRVVAGASTVVPSGTWTKVLLDSEEFDTNSNFAANRFTPTVAGYYAVTAGVQWGGTTGGNGLCAIYKNGAAVAHSAYVALIAAGLLLNAATMVYMNGTTDYLELHAIQTTASSLNVLTGTATNLSVVMVRPA